MRRIFAVVFFSLIMCASSLAQYTISQCKSGTFNNCTDGVTQCPAAGAWVDFYYTACPNTPNQHKHISQYDTGCLEFWFDCLDGGGYEKIVCNDCTQDTFVYTYLCNAC